MDGRRSQDTLVGLTLGAVLGNGKDTTPQVNRTLLDIIRAEDPNSTPYKNLIDHHHNKTGWKTLKDRFRLKRAAATWTASVSASNDPFLHDVVSTTHDTVTDTAAVRESNRGPALAQLLHHHSARLVEPVYLAHEDDQFGEVPRVRLEQLLYPSLSSVLSVSPQIDSTREELLHTEHVQVSDVPSINNLSLMLRPNSFQSPSLGQSEVPVQSVTVRLSEALAAERELIQRAVSSTQAARMAEDEQELAESGNDYAVRGEENVVPTNEQQQVRMSLMDLLEQTDRQMGWSSYNRDFDETNQDDDEDAEDSQVEGNNLVEHNCCVCMVRHKGSAFIPCGHTFCRLCSRELWVNRGNCPICNGFIVEILDIF